RFGSPNTYTNEVAIVSLNAPGKVSQTTGTNHTITATIFNGSNSTLTNVPVSLNITGANPFTATTTISSITPGTTTNIAFAAYNPTALGASNMQVTLAADQNTLNNSASWTQSTSCNIIAANPASVAPISYSAGVGFNTGSGKIFVRSSTASSQTLIGVHIGISSTSSNGGNSVFAAVADNAGNIIATSNTVVLIPSMYNNYTLFSFSPPVPFTANTNYFVGIAQPAGSPGYFPLGATASSIAIVTPTIYATQSFTGGAISTLTENYGYFAIEPIFATTLCSSVGFTDVNNLKPVQVKVYPNPASNYVSVNISNVNDKTTLQVMDVLGKVVMERNNLEETNELNLTTLNKGVYFIRIKNGKENCINKLIIE
ncbi:MAG: T9SS type A sorting domain-containing protein, partial [Bacteroidia bacterium]|nr:T9SS type A sorting domain-containing protein [Bacteroidia bacterium]